MADSDKLGLGLDDIIRIDGSTNRRGGRGGRRGLRARGGGGPSRGGGSFSDTSNGFRTRGGGGIVRTSLPSQSSPPFSSLQPRTSNPPVGRWKHDLYEDNGNRARLGQRTGGVNSTTKLLISNLDYGVTTVDVQVKEWTV